MMSAIGVAAVLLQSSSPPGVDWSGLVWHGLVDVLLAGVLVLNGLRRRPGNTELAFSLMALNVGLFATLVAVSGDAFTSGAGFGLFGMLSLIRLRSASFTTVDMGYAFLTLVIALVMGLLDLPLLPSAILATAAVLVAVVGDHPRINVSTQELVVVLDRLHTSPLSIRIDVEERTNLLVRSVQIQEVDYVRETTTVMITCLAPNTVKLRRGRSPALGVPVRTPPQG